MISLTGTEIAFLLEEMGIKNGDTVIVHSSLSSMGKVDGGPDVVIDSLLEVVGKEGTLAMPAFSDNMTDPFDPEKTKSDVGIITEVFRKRKGVLRSWHPTHSVCALGKNSLYITRGHELSETSCGRETPFYKIKELNGKVVLIGVDMNRNTTLHAIEEEADSPYLVEKVILPAPVYPGDIEDPSGQKEGKTITIRKFPSGHRDFLKLAPLLRKHGLITEGYIGTALTGVMSCSSLFPFVLQLLETTPDFFLCNNIYCNSCVAGRGSINGKYYPEKNRVNRCKNMNCEVCLT